MRIDRRVHHTGSMNFPLCHYHGLTIGFQLERAEKAFKAAMPSVLVDLNQLSEKFGSGEKPFVIRKNEAVERIFSDLYNVPSEIRTDYFRIKITELLIRLSMINAEERSEEKPYFYSGQIEKIKAMHELMVSDLSKSYTLDELSAEFDMSLSTLKSCFKGVYGSPVYSYMREYRMNYAASLLVQDSHMKINEIAALVGYDNPSKFSAAFRDTMGVTPLEYRKKTR
ncbi:MAG: helix-turn-helix transcriptional regulator [Ruminiclostridium sp.]|nr:helix-turn-helix transcriptional regulator [Ruminiclostridium sp.]